MRASNDAITQEGRVMTMDPEHMKERNIETYRSIVTHSSAAIKAVMLVNGGSAVALLAFMGNVWKENGASAVPDIIWPMVFFVAGLSLGTLTAGTAYLTQFTLYRENTRIATGKWWDDHELWLQWSIGLLILGLVCFVVGGIWAAYEFSQTGK